MIHNISLPPGEFGGPQITELFLEPPASGRAPLLRRRVGRAGVVALPRAPRRRGDPVRAVRAARLARRGLELAGPRAAATTSPWASSSRARTSCRSRTRSTTRSRELTRALFERYGRLDARGALGHRAGAQDRPGAASTGRATAPRRDSPDPAFRRPESQHPRGLPGPFPRAGHPANPHGCWPRANIAQSLRSNARQGADFPQQKNVFRSACAGGFPFTRLCGHARSQPLDLVDRAVNKLWASPGDNSRIFTKKSGPWEHTPGPGSEQPPAASQAARRPQNSITQRRGPCAWLPISIPRRPFPTRS